MVVGPIINLIDKLPVNPATLLWTLGAVIAFPLSLWLWLQTIIDDQVAKALPHNDDGDTTRRISSIGKRWAFGRLVTSACFLIVGLVSLTFAPMHLHQTASVEVRSAVIVLSFLIAEALLISSSVSNIRDRLWVFRNPALIRNYWNDALHPDDQKIAYNTQIKELRERLNALFDDLGKERKNTSVDSNSDE